MCTGLAFNSNDFYFGRNLDYDFSYGESIVICPRNYNFKFRHLDSNDNHYAIIGVAHVINDYPLFYDAMNEKGLCIAGLNFVGNTVYNNYIENKTNITSFEIIPYILINCQNIKEVKALFKKINVTREGFSENLKPSQLHYLISDNRQSIVLEIRKDGIKIFDNPYGVLTNNPPFEIQSFNVNNYMKMSNKNPKNEFSKKLKLIDYSRGQGAIGIPGDLSSMSRFIKVLFTKENALKGMDEENSVNQFFHILLSVEQQKGVCEVNKNMYEYTIYSDCYNANKGIMYYKTYDSFDINKIDMFKEDLNKKELIVFEMKNKCSFINQN